MIQTKRADFDKIAKQFHIDPVTVRIIRNRGIESEEGMNQYLNGTPESLYDPLSLKDMEAAVSILKEKIAEEKKIRIVGDYDIDGVCSTYLLLTALRRLGARVDYE
ncbi:MAG: single-stranded-DNA-specific exonuclease RecJ, partial [Clostridium sp.]